MKPYTLEARLGTKRIKRRFSNIEEARAFAEQLKARHILWSEKDFLVITKAEGREA